ncbi:MAG: TonB-dependent receptor [Pseudomonadota bacterium]
MKTIWNLGAATVALIAASAQAQDRTNADEDDDIVIVTGVFREQSIEKAPVAVTALNEDEIDRALPVSAADLLRNVPGVFVNSALGEIRNVVYSRGVSAGSTEAASGYFYVSLQEDGLPVSNVTFSNYGPDYFARPDLTLSSLEALRGGTATITGPNAPGGIFNYITKNGRTHEGTEVAFRYGLEGDGENPYYRGDFYHGGAIGDRDDLFYSVGGFYRSSDGARNPGYTLNEGGQIKGNLLWDYGEGELLFTAKYLNDRNGFFEFLPARNFNDPELVEGIDATDSFLPPASPHSWQNPSGGTSSWDGRDLVKSEQFSLSAKWDHEFSNGLSFSNSFRYSDSETDWNTGAVIFSLPITDPFVYILSNSFGFPGTFEFRNPSDGSLVAEVVSTTGFDHTLTQNNLPNQQILDGGVLTQVAFDPRHQVDEVMNQFTVSKEWERHAVTGGIFYSHADINRRFDGGGFGISPIADQPPLYDITLTLPGGGPTLDITSPEGWASLGDAISGGLVNDGTQEQISLFFGHNFSITDRLILDWGLRYEDISYEITNTVPAAAPNFGDPSEGGADGNPLTLFDNFPNVQLPPISTDRDYDYLSYSASLSYQWTDDILTYLRFSSGEKAPDFQTLIDLDTVDEADSLFVDPQEITQVELGIKWDHDYFNLALFPFWSELDNVTSPQLFTDGDGINYSPPPVGGTLTTWGVEVEADVFFTDYLTLTTALTLQTSESENFGLFEENTPSRDDDTFVPIPDGDADNIPNVLARSSLVYVATDRVSSFVTWNYIGDRPANRFNAFELPGFSTVDLGIIGQVTDKLTIRGDIKNALNNEDGVMSWAPSGGFVRSLDRQALTREAVAADPNQLFSVITAQPRAYFVTLNYSF